jgi:Uma2 family endonuclease
VVIEVISPGSAIYDRNTKADTYEALGVKELWLVDEAQKIVEIRKLYGNHFRRGKSYSGRRRVESSVLKGLSFTVRSIFSD